jgi:hypothetical protein
MQKAILCTIDFSQSSRHTLQCAAKLASDLNVHLTVLFTYRLMKVKTDEVFQRKKEIEQKAAADFALLENELLKGKGISYDFKMEVGFLADRVDAYARKSQIGYVVIDRNMSVESREAFDDLVVTMSVPTLIVP